MIGGIVQQYYFKFPITYCQTNQIHQIESGRKVSGKKFFIFGDLLRAARVNIRSRYVFFNLLHSSSHLFSVQLLFLGD